MRDDGLVIADIVFGDGSLGEIWTKPKGSRWACGVLRNGSETVFTRKARFGTELAARIVAKTAADKFNDERFPGTKVCSR